MITLEKKPGPRRLLLDPQTNRYYKGAGEWTVRPEQARSFEDIEYIRSLVKYCRLLNAELVEQSSNGHPDVHIPLDERSLGPNGSRYAVGDGPPKPRTAFPRSSTTGELLQEVQRERDAAKFDLLEAQKSIEKLNRKLSALKTNNR